MKNFLNINVFFYFLYVLFIFLIFIIPDIPTDTFNLDDKIWYFLQKFLYFEDGKRDYILLVKDLYTNCNLDVHCLNYVKELNANPGVYFFIGLINQFLFELFSFNSSDEIINISKTYFTGFIVLHFFSFFYLLLVFSNILISKKKTEQQYWYFFFSISLIPLFYIDGKLYNFIISVPIYYSFIPTVYVPRGAMSVFIIGIFYLIFSNKNKTAIISLLFLIGFHAGQALLIVSIVLVYHIILSLINYKNLINLFFILLVFIFNIYLLSGSLLDIQSTNFEDLLNIYYSLNQLFKLVSNKAYVIFLIIFFKNLYIFYNLKKNFIQSNKDTFVLIIILEGALILAFFAEVYFIKIYYNKDLNVVMHSLAQIYMRLFGMLIVPIVTINLVLILNHFSKSISQLVIRKVYLIFIILVIIINFKTINNNFKKTLINLDHWKYELKYYIARDRAYIFEENFSDKDKQFKKFLSLEELKFGNPIEIIRPDINDIDLLISIYFKLKSKYN